MVLMEDVWVFEWRVLDGRTMEWLYDWDLAGRLPLQMELVFMRTQYSEPIRQVFWITPKQNPEVMMRQLQQGPGQGGTAPGGGLEGATGGAPGGGAPGSPPVILPEVRVGAGPGGNPEGGPR